jgi:hypothetical protein
MESILLNSMQQSSAQHFLQAII